MIKIVTDSTAYLPDDYIKEHDIRAVPLYVHFGKEAFKEGVDLSDEEFYARLKKEAELPTTSQPSAGEFHKVYKEHIDAGHEIITLTISSKLSGTWNSAMAAKDMLPEAGISVIDTLATSVSLQLIVEAAVEAVNTGASRQEIVNQIEEMKQRTRLFFAVDTLEYLAKGGRIGNAKALVGGLLKVKPILTLQDGAIEPLEQVRSKKKVQARLIEIVNEYVGSDGSKAKIIVANSLVPEEAEKLGQELQARLGCAKPGQSPLGPVIGTHTGPGLVGAGVFV